MTDYISRADAIEAVLNAHPMAEVVKGSSKQVIWVRVSDVAKALKALPSADAVHGEWELHEDIDGEYGICSVCRNDADFSHYGKPYAYCPNCGAKMKGGA